MNYYIKFGRLTYRLQTVISILILGLLIYFELRGGRSYFDEGLALACMIYVTLLFLKKRLDATDQVSVMLLFMVIAIGILSNIMSKLAYSWFSIFVDIIWKWNNDSSIVYHIFNYNLFDIYTDNQEWCRINGFKICYSTFKCRTYG